MSDWNQIKEIINTIGVIVAVCISVIGLLKAYKEKHSEQWKAYEEKHNAQLNAIEDQITTIEKNLNDHRLEDEHCITELQTNVKNLTDNVNSKLDLILRVLDK